MSVHSGRAAPSFLLGLTGALHSTPAPFTKASLPPLGDWFNEPPRQRRQLSFNDFVLRQDCTRFSLSSLEKGSHCSALDGERDRQTLTATVRKSFFFKEACHLEKKRCSPNVQNSLGKNNNKDTEAFKQTKLSPPSKVYSAPLIPGIWSTILAYWSLRGLESGLKLLGQKPFHSCTPDTSKDGTISTKHNTSWVC